MDLVTYALLNNKLKSSGSIVNETVSVNDSGQLVLSTTLPYIDINFETGNLETNCDKFSVKDNNLIFA